MVSNSYHFQPETLSLDNILVLSFTISHLRVLMYLVDILIQSSLIVIYILLMYTFLLHGQCHSYHLTLKDFWLGWFGLVTLVHWHIQTEHVEQSYDPTGHRPKTELLCPLERNVAASSCEINHAGKNVHHPSLSVTHAILVLPFMEFL